MGLKYNSLVLVCLISFVAASAIAADDKKPATDKPAVEQKAGDAKAIDKDKKDSAAEFVVPNGTPRELIEFMKKVVDRLRREPATRQQARDAILAAAEKILAQKASEEELEFAVQAKMMILSNEKQLAEFSQDLAKKGQPKLARLVRSYALQLRLGQIDDNDVKELKKGVDEVLKYLKEDKLQTSDVGLAFLAGNLAETVDDNAFTIQTYNSLATIFAASSDQRLADLGKRFTGVVRRLELPGHEMKIEGNLLDGKPFDWSPYAGKVVLVDFWATWCGPWVAEMKNLKEAYSLYHDKGFEIVGISLDRRRADLDRFVEEKKVPWAIVFDGDKPSATVAYYGVMSIPTQILIDQKGKVVSLHARGPELRELLAKLLGKAEPTKAKKKPEAAKTPADATSEKKPS